MKYDLSNSLDKQKAITAFKNHLEKGERIWLEKLKIPPPPEPPKGRIIREGKQPPKPKGLYEN